MNCFQKDPAEKFEMFWEIEAKGVSKSAGRNDLSVLCVAMSLVNTQIHLLHFEFDF